MQVKENDWTDLRFAITIMHINLYSNTLMHITTPGESTVIADIVLRLNMRKCITQYIPLSKRQHKWTRHWFDRRKFCKISVRNLDRAPVHRNLLLLPKVNLTSLQTVESSKVMVYFFQWIGLMRSQLFTKSKPLGPVTHWKLVSYGLLFLMRESVVFSVFCKK